MERSAKQKVEKKGKGRAYCDITGRKFGRLTAMFPLNQPGRRGSKLWRCRCECGNELDVPYNTLLYSNTRSCGCKKREHDQVMTEHLSRIAGTSMDYLKSKKVPSNNTTGVKGVYQDRQGRYVARIAFQRKQYWLGAFWTLDEAAAVRRIAEEAINEKVTDYYERWKACAEEDPEWASGHPIEIGVKRIDGKLVVSISPEIDQGQTGC